MNSKEHIEALLTIMTEGRSIKEIEDGWSHFYSIKSDFEYHYSNDKYIMSVLRALEEGLSDIHIARSPEDAIPVHWVSRALVGSSRLS